MKAKGGFADDLNYKRRHFSYKKIYVIVVSTDSRIKKSPFRSSWKSD